MLYRGEHLGQKRMKSADCRLPISGRPKGENPGLFSRKETEQQGPKWKRGPTAKEKEEIA